MTAVRNANPTKNVAATEIEKVRQPEQAERHDRVGRPRLDPQEHGAEDEAEQHQAADDRIGPVVALLVRQADQERRRPRR